ncbi:hypothetical protein [Mammaliicoccus lentus]|uniref:Uncharacterized protein n=1 Tax=Mammaliicoccus lentus TaxID=42858 RepID=A0ABS6GW38_MAMLE|nr:hypothetical protein [Mammaliicoccus lentus]MBU6113349.1 hypothetical protein [Mammaliicoccus lentus]
MVGNPKKINKGKTIREPPADTILIVPAKIPTKKMINNVKISNITPPVIINDSEKFIICKKYKPDINNVFITKYLLEYN